MKVIMSFEFNDQEREDIVKYFRHKHATLGLPRLATRKLCHEFIQEAVEAKLDPQEAAHR